MCPPNLERSSITSYATIPLEKIYTSGEDTALKILTKKCKKYYIFTKIQAGFCKKFVWTIIL